MFNVHRIFLLMSHYFVQSTTGTWPKTSINWLPSPVLEGQKLKRFENSLHKFHKHLTYWVSISPCEPSAFTKASQVSHALRLSESDELSAGKRRFLPRKTMSYDPELIIENTTNMCANQTVKLVKPRWRLKVHTENLSISELHAGETCEGWFRILRKRSSIGIFL